MNELSKDDRTDIADLRAELAAAPLGMSNDQLGLAMVIIGSWATRRDRAAAVERIKRLSRMEGEKEA